MVKGWFDSTLRTNIKIKVMYKVIKEHSGTKAGTKIKIKPRPDLEKYMVDNGYWEKIDPGVKTRKKKVIEPKENK